MSKVGILNLNFTTRVQKENPKLLSQNYNMSDRDDGEQGEGEDFSSKQQGDAASCGSDGVSPSLEQPTVRCFHGFESFEHTLSL